MGSNKVTQVALGVSEETEVRKGISELSKKLVGNVGLFFTNEGVEQVRKYVD